MDREPISFFRKKKSLVWDDFILQYANELYDKSILEEIRYQENIYDKWLRMQPLSYIEARDLQLSNGINPVMLAAIWGRLDLLYYSLELGYPIDQQTREGITALMFASFRGDYGMVRNLHQLGANLFITSEINRDALFYSTIEKPSQLFQEFLELLSIPSNLYEAFYQSISADTKHKFGEKQLLDRYFIQEYLLEAGAIEQLQTNGDMAGVSALDFYILNPYMKNLSIIDAIKKAGISSHVVDEELINREAKSYSQKRVLQKKYDYMKKQM